MPSDEQLKQALAKMLPKKVDMRGDNENIMCWAGSADADYHNRPTRVLDTEFLHLCWLVEERLEAKPYYFAALENVIASDGHGSNIFEVAHATWQQRTIALAQVKGVALL